MMINIADADDTFGENLGLFFFSTRVKYLCLCHLIVPLVSVPCYCTSSVSVLQLVFGLFCSSLFLFSGLLPFLENQGCDIASDYHQTDFLKLL